MKRLSREIIFQSDHLSQDLNRKTVRGSLTVMTAQGIRFVLGVAGTMALARLLTPADYGIIGMVMVVVAFAQMFKDAGLAMATVQKDSITHEQISTLFWANLLISVFLSACVLASSPLVAMFYGHPELTAVSAVLSSTFLISGLAIQHQALLQRHMMFGLLAVVQVTSQVITLGVTITLACFGWRYWALVGGSITSALAATLLILFFCPWFPGRMQKGCGVRDMLAFGGHLTGFNFVNYFSRNLDKILIGRFIGVDDLGIYTKAYELFLFPVSQIRTPALLVGIPVLSSICDQPDRYIKYFQRYLDILALLTIPVALYCAIEAEFLIQILLGPQWLGAVPVFRILSIAGLIQPIAGGARGLVLLSHGFSSRYLYWGLFNALATVAAIAAGVSFGIEGVATAYLVATYAVLVPSLFYCFHNTPVTVSLFMKTLVVPLFVGAIAAAGAVLARYAILDNSIAGHLVILVIFGGIYVGGSCRRKSVRETMGLFLKDLPLLSRTSPKGGSSHQDTY